MRKWLATLGRQRQLPLFQQNGYPASPEEIRAMFQSLNAMFQSLNAMLAEVEKQAEEINSYALHLDAANRELKRLSYQDKVTQLWNRHFFDIRLQEEMERSARFEHPLSLVAVDLDGFKAVNDRHGHAAGDETLLEVARVLKRISRNINLICRLGGDEFAVILVETTREGAERYAERVRNAIERHRFSHDTRITASIGIAAFPQAQVRSPKEFLKLADDGLYAAKRAGKNRVLQAA